MPKDKKFNKLSIKKRIFHTFLEYAVSLLGGLMVFLCIYWFFHFETWWERFTYIFITIFVVYGLVKILPDRPEQ